MSDVVDNVKFCEIPMAFVRKDFLSKKCGDALCLSHTGQSESWVNHKAGGVIWEKYRPRVCFTFFSRCFPVRSDVQFFPSVVSIL